MTHQIRTEEPGYVGEGVNYVDPLHLIKLLLSCPYQTVLERGFPGIQLQYLRESNMNQNRIAFLCMKTTFYFMCTNNDPFGIIQLTIFKVSWANVFHYFWRLSCQFDLWLCMCLVNQFHGLNILPSFQLKLHSYSWFSDPCVPFVCSETRYKPIKLTREHFQL